MATHGTFPEMPTDQRYKAIKSLINSKSLHLLSDVFTIMPFSIVRQDMKINYNTLRRRVYSGHTLTVKDIVSLASLFEVDPAEILRLAINETNAKSKGKKSGSAR